MTRNASHRSTLLALLLLVAASACHRPRNRASEPWAPSVEAVTPPVAVGSLGPVLSLDTKGRALLSWLDPVPPDAQALRFSVLESGRWAPARTVAQGQNVLANSADTPWIAAQLDVTHDRTPRLVAAWLARSSRPGGEGYGVRLSISPDGGLSWFAPLTPHRDNSEAEHGFASSFTQADGTMVLSWLDGRSTLDSSGEPAPGGATALMSATLGSDGVLGLESVVDPRACDCCPTACVATTSGAVLAWRDRTSDEVRDISVATWREGRWSEPRTLFPEGWRVEGCPVNGPALAAQGDLVVAAWFTGAASAAHVNVSFSTDGGLKFGRPFAIDGGKPLGRTSVALLANGTAVVAWIELEGEGGAVKLRKCTAEGPACAAFTLTPLIAPGRAGRPRLVRVGGSLVAAWTLADATGPPLVRTAIVRP